MTFALIFLRFRFPNPFPNLLQFLSLILSLIFLRFLSTSSSTYLSTSPSTYLSTSSSTYLSTSSSTYLSTIINCDLFDIIFPFAEFIDMHNRTDICPAKIRYALSRELVKFRELTIINWVMIFRALTYLLIRSFGSTGSEDFL